MEFARQRVGCAASGTPEKRKERTWEGKATPPYYDPAKINGKATVAVWPTG